MANPALELLEEMLKIYSPSRREGPLAAFLAEKMESLGFRGVKVDSALNVIGEAGSGSPVTLLCGHMDTVPGRQPVLMDERFICGRGACDAKSPLAALILAASKFVDRKDAGTVIAAGVSDEEGEGLGINQLVKDGIKADYAIFGEPSGVDNITIAYKGSFTIQLLCKTASVHASAPWMTENSIEKMLEVWQAVKEHLAKYDDPNDRNHSVTASLTEIKGGVSHNVTPGTCRITINVRVPSQLTCSQVADEIGGVITEFQRDLSFPKLKMRLGGFTEPFEADKNSLLVRALIRAGLKVRGRRPLLLRKTGTGDMNVLGKALGIPVVTYGPGNSHQSHTRRECVEIQDYLASIDVISEALVNLAQFSSNHNQ
ncbi:MAG: M20/M25/M40 family metallo-hydrolase [Thaumarchaeota archaeon]|nr:M20/M25/M40 family metallo-hydrolase [Nitrososphaerota archaeon]